MRSLPARLIVWFLAVLSSVAGLYVSDSLTRQHYGATGEKPSFLENVCTAYEGSSCAKVSQSRWGTIPFGASKDEPHVPTSELGMLYFAFMLSWLLLIGWCGHRRVRIHLLFVLTTLVGAGIAAWFEVIMWTRLEAWCPLCLFTHVASGLLLVFALLLWPRRPRVTGDAAATVMLPGSGSTGDASLFGAPPARRPDDAEGSWPHGWTVVNVGVVALLLVGTLHFQILYAQNRKRSAGMEKAYRGLTAQLAYFDNYWEQTYLAWKLTPPVQIPLEDAPALGPADAAHTVVIFSDFQCPGCAKFEEYLRKTVMPMARKARGGVRFYFKHWPISTACNPTSRWDLHPLACEAARAAEAARILGGDEVFWKMHDLLFETQKAWKDKPDFPAMARGLGLDEERFRETMNSPEVGRRIRESIEAGDRLGLELVESKVLTEQQRDMVRVTSTPAVYVDGKRLASPRHARTWRTIFEGPRGGGPPATAPARPALPYGPVEDAALPPPATPHEPPESAPPPQFPVPASAGVESAAEHQGAQP